MEPASLIKVQLHVDWDNVQIQQPQHQLTMDVMVIKLIVQLNVQLMDQHALL